MKKTIWILVIVIVGLIISRADRSAADEYKVGFIIPLSGDGLVYGEPLRNTAQLAVDEINAAGGIDGKLIVPIFEDGKCNGTAGANAAQKLINVDKVKVIIGGVCSNETLSALPIAESGKVALISPSASTPDLSGKSAYFFRVYPSANAQGRLLANHAYDQGKRNVAFISEQDDFTKGIQNAFAEAFDAKGGNIIEETFLPGTKDFKTQLSKLKAQNPDVLFINPLNPGTGDIIIRQLAVMGWKPQIIINDPITGDLPTIQKNKAMLEGAWTSEFTVDASNSKYANLVTGYKAKYGKEISFQTFAQTMYDSVYVVRDGIDAVGYNGAKISKWGRSIKDWQGASGSITIDSNGDRVGGPILEVIKEGAMTKLMQ